jgi:hypothetical protein
VTTTEYQDLLLDAYRGELFGEAYFKALADAETDEGKREKLRALEELELRTGDMLRKAVAAEGLDDSDHPESREVGAQIGRANIGMPWDEWAQGLAAVLPDFLAKFRRCREVSPDPADEVMVMLVAHEEAIAEFARLELAGEGDKSLEVIQNHLASAP